MCEYENALVNELVEREIRVFVYSCARAFVYLYMLRDAFWQEIIHNFASIIRFI